MKLSDLFEIEYPRTLALADMAVKKNGVNFVSSQEKNNGVAAKVEECEGIKKYPAGVITVPLKGSVLMAHLQPEPCYVAHQIAVLMPKKPMAKQEKLFYCLCIQKNAYRFNYGRQADKTLKNMIVPDTVPEWVKQTEIKQISTRAAGLVASDISDIAEWEGYTMDSLFRFAKGKRLVRDDIVPGNTNFLGAICENNGVREKIETDFVWKPNCITVNYNGSVGEAFYQAEPFWASDDVNILYAKDFWEMNKYNAMFLITVIKANSYRFGYGRKWTIEKMKETVIKLPCLADGTPDFIYMENYIKSLRYSDRI